jgi:hypothetical protein
MLLKKVIFSLVFFTIQGIKITLLFNPYINFYDFYPLRRKEINSKYDVNHEL